LLIAATLVWGAMTALCGFAQTFVRLLIARAGIGLGGGSPPSHAMISDLYRPHERASAMSSWHMGNNIGLFVALFAGGYAALSEAADRTLLSACADDAGICSKPKLAAMRAEISRLRTLPLAERIAGVNHFVNTAFRYATDMQTYGKSDHWALLKEFLTRGQGDCEDFVIAKFWMLIALDVPPEAIRLVVLRDVVSQVDYTILAVERGGEALILDNCSNIVRTKNELAQYRPIFSMSGNGGIWVHLVASMNVARADSAFRMPAYTVLQS